MSANELMDLEDKRRLEFTLAARETVVREVMKNGLPQQASDKIMLMQALDGLDRTILSRAKIKSDDTAQQQQQQTTRLIGDILSRISVTNPQTRKQSLPALDPSVTITDMVDGETHEGVQTLSYDEFIKP